MSMKLAIADPPYLGRAALWYGGNEHRADHHTPGRSRGRAKQAPEYHPDAHLWDEPERHWQLMADLDRDYDGWALAASAKTLPVLAQGIPDGARIAIWHVTNAIPDGNRVSTRWEPVILRQPDARRAYGTGYAIGDVLSAPHPMSSFVGAKPDTWTRWVLDMLGYQPGDQVDDLFPGSGAVQRAMEVLL